MSELRVIDRVGKPDPAPAISLFSIMECGRPGRVGSVVEETDERTTLEIYDAFVYFAIESGMPFAIGRSPDYPNARTFRLTSR